LQPYPSTFVGAGANQEVFDFGRIAAQAAAEDARVEVEQRSAEVAELEVNFEVEEAYLAVFAAKAVMRASDDAYQRARVHRDFAKVGVSAGMRPPIELTRSEADLARFDVGRLRALGGLEIAQTVLAAAVGSPEAKLDVVDTPPTLQAMPALQTAIARAQLRDPRLRQALSELKAQEAQTRSLASALLPDLSLSLSVTGRAGGAAASGNGESPYGSGWLPTTPNWDVGLVFSWPLFDGTVQAKRDASRAFEGGRREEIDQVKQQQIAAIRESYSRFHIARGVLQGLGDGLTAAKANYEQADARFKSGMGTSVELADAEAIRTDAEIQLALGEFELARARAAFGRAIAEGM
jgi:outer membrane protein TolC